MCRPCTATARGSASAPSLEVDAVRQRVEAVGGDSYELRERAGRHRPEQHALGAEVVIPGATGYALAAIPQRLHRHALTGLEAAHSLAQLRDLARVLVPRRDVGRGREYAVVVVQVRPADSTRPHPDQHLARPRRQLVGLADLDRLFAGKEGSAHVARILARAPDEVAAVSSSHARAEPADELVGMALGAARRPMSIIELIRAGNLDARLAAMLWIAMERGASLIVAADPPSSGKTTTLSALLAFTPPDTAVYFTRGQGETFSLPPRSDSYPTYILINEMSDHIPVYTWDDNARRAFELLADGYSMATTMHDETVEGVIRQLREDLSIPAEHIAKLTFIITMYVGRLGGMMRRVQDVAMLELDADELTVHRIATWDLNSDSFEVLPQPEHRRRLAEWAGLTAQALDAEMAKREGFLTTLLNTGATSIPEVNNAIESFYEELINPRPPA